MKLTHQYFDENCPRFDANNILKVKLKIFLLWKLYYWLSQKVLNLFEIYNEHFFKDLGLLVRPPASSKGEQRFSEKTSSTRNSSSYSQCID